MIRKTLDTDIPAVMAIYDTARSFMRAHGNATQWPEGKIGRASCRERVCLYV